MQFDSQLLGRLRAIVGAENVLISKEDLIPYSFDGTAALQQMPGCVVFALSRDHVRAVLLLANETKTPVVTRGSGTGLSGGGPPSQGFILLLTGEVIVGLEGARAKLTL